MKNVAIVGFGGQGNWHFQTTKEQKDIKVIGAFDIDDNRVDFMKKQGIKAYCSLDEILNDDAVDIVVCATPNDSHKDIVIRSLRAGKNVICEKPVTMTVEALDQMIEVANETGKLFSVHQNRRWDSDFLCMKSIADSKELGEVIRIESRVHGSRGIPGDWRGTKAAGGGMILDWGVHLIDQILCMFQDDTVVKVWCETTHITNTEVDDGFRLELTFQSGKTAYIEVGTYNFINLPRFYMQCTEGTALIEDWVKDATVVKMTEWGEKDAIPVQTAAGITKTMAPRAKNNIQTYIKPKPQSDVFDYYRNFVATIDNKEDSIIKLSQVRRCMCVMQAAFDSSESQQVLKVNI